MQAPTDRPPASPSFEELAARLAPVVGVPPERLHPTDRLVHDVELDELSMAQLVLAIQDVNPYFDLPPQLDVAEITLADLHHFCCVMSAGHAETSLEDNQP